MSIAVLKPWLLKAIPAICGLGYAAPLKAMSKTAEYESEDLPTVSRRLGATIVGPRAIAAGCVIALTALGWLYLAIQLASMHAEFAPLKSLCQPTFGVTAPDTVASLFVITMMWAAMVLAMMLPTAAPMIMTYADIAEAAAAKGDPIVSPLVIMSGYVVVWLGFSILASIIQLSLGQLAVLDSGMRSANVLLSGAIFVAAGLYQFSSLKHACLRACRLPFPFFFANWQTSARGVFRLGVQQGLFCLGCCWAMMIVMFAVGTMNVIWMAILGALMTLEKIAAGRWISGVTGSISIAIGAGLVAAAIVGY